MHPLLTSVTRCFARRPGAAAILVLLGSTLTACGGPATDPGASAEDTAKAFIANWEANDGARIEQLVTSDARQFWAMGGGSSSWLASKTKYYGTPIKEKGRVLKVVENGNTAQADVAVLYDCKAAECHPAAGLPDWVPQGDTLSTQHLTLQKQTDGKWLISYFTDSSYFAEQAKATEQALAAPTQTAAMARQQATQQAYQVQADAQRTAYVVSQQATQQAYQDMVDAQSTNVAATKAAIPTVTPTSVPVHTTAKAAYQAGVADAIHQWSGDAILYRVFDHCYQCINFGYDPNVYVYDPSKCSMFSCDSEPYDDGDGTSRQWLFFVASPARKEVRVIRVLDGKIQQQDVSAALYRDTFGAQGSPPAPLDMTTAIDSDQVVKSAREHGYKVEKVADMTIRLSTEDAKQYRYSNAHKAADANWAIFGDSNKVIVLNPKTGEVMQNDF